MEFWNIQVNDLGFLVILLFAYIIYWLKEMKTNVECIYLMTRDYEKSLDGLGNMFAALLDHMGVEPPCQGDGSDERLTQIRENIEAIKEWDNLD